MSRTVVYSLYATLVVIWSSTWVAIAIGLDGTPPLLGAGLRFTLAGVGLLAVAKALGRPLKTDPLLAVTLATLPFALMYGLIYWAEQYIPSGLTAVLFGVMPLYVAGLSMVWLKEEPVTPRFFAGVGIALGGLVLAFSESLSLGHTDRAVLAAIVVVLCPLAAAIGNLAIKRRGRDLDPVALNGYAMLGGGLLLLAASAPGEDWGAAHWTAEAIGSLLYLTVFGSAISFVILTMLLKELPAITLSYLPLILPFGALAFGWALQDEALTAPAIAGAALVAVGLAVAQIRRVRSPAAARLPAR